MTLMNKGIIVFALIIVSVVAYMIFMPEGSKKLGNSELQNGTVNKNSATPEASAYKINEEVIIIKDKAQKIGMPASR